MGDLALPGTSWYDPLTDGARYPKVGYWPCVAVFQPRQGHDDRKATWWACPGTDARAATSAPPVG